MLLPNKIGVADARPANGLIPRFATDLIGGTPLVALRFFSAGTGRAVLGKLEAMNPGTSVKDRSALGLIEDAERRGLLRPGATVIESTSGNMGHALAMICAQKGYRFICVLDPKSPESNICLVQAYGGEVVIVDETDESGGYQIPRIRRARELVSKIPNSVNLDQYANRAAVDVHYHSTGPEILEQTGGDLDLLVGTVSTGSHLCGTARFLKERNPRLRVAGLEPEGSVIFGGIKKPYLQNGTGLSFVAGNVDATLIDHPLKISDTEAFAMCRFVAESEGLLLGGSAGSALAGALKLAPTVRPGGRVVALLPDGGMKYLGSIYSDPWLREMGILDGVRADLARLRAAFKSSPAGRADA